VEYQKLMQNVGYLLDQKILGVLCAIDDVE